MFALPSSCPLLSDLHLRTDEFALATVSMNTSWRTKDRSALLENLIFIVLPGLVSAGTMVSAAEKFVSTGTWSSRLR